MASIPKLLMDEFYSMERAAINEEKYDRAQAFSASENAVNNVMHGLGPQPGEGHPDQPLRRRAIPGG